MMHMPMKDNVIKQKQCGQDCATAYNNDENISSYHLSLSSTDSDAEGRARSVKSEIILRMIYMTTILCLAYLTFEAEEEPHGRFLESKPHKDLLPLDSKDVIGFFLATLGLMVAAGGGVGGGGILVPIYILIMNFKPKHAIPLSNATVFGGAIANTLLDAHERHPLADRPVIDWDLILVMEPLTIGGALAGAFVNKMLNERLLVSMLVLLLSSTAYTTLKKAVKMYRKESGAMMEKGSELTAITRRVQDEEDNMKDGSNEEERKWLLEKEEKELKVTNVELDKILQEEKEVPVTNLVILGATFAVVLLVNLAKGGGAFASPLGIRCGSTPFWVANVFLLGWTVFMMLLSRSYLIHRHYIKERVSYPYVEGDIKWDERNTIVYPVLCCAAGLFAGMFGIGGGIVMGPLMIAMGVNPSVTKAASACMILFTSFTATTSYVVFGLFKYDYAWACFVLGFSATYIGHVGLTYLMKKYGRSSYIAFSIGGVVLLSAFFMTMQSIVSMAEGTKSSSGGLCGKN